MSEKEDHEEEHHDDEVPASPSGRGLSLPLSRVKRLVKAEADVKVVTNEAAFLIGRAVELVLDEMAAKAHQSMCRDARKSLLYKDVAFAVKEWEALDVLADFVPQKVLVSTILQQQQKQQPQQPQR